MNISELIKSNQMKSVDVSIGSWENIFKGLGNHWAYYIFGSIFIVIFIVSCIYSYFSFVHPTPKETIEESKGFRKFWLKNKVPFFLMLDIISILCAIFFMAVNSVNPPEPTTSKSNIIVPKKFIELFSYLKTILL